MAGNCRKTNRNMEIVKGILLDELTYTEAGKKYSMSKVRVADIFTSALQRGRYSKGYKPIKYKDIKSMCETDRISAYYDALSYERSCVKLLD